MYLKKMAPVSDTLMATMACSFSRWRVVQHVLKGQGVLTQLSLWPYYPCQDLIEQVALLEHGCKRVIKFIQH